VKKGGLIMATGVSYYKCSPELYAKYLAAGRIVDTDFYFVEDKILGISKLYLGKILLSNSEGRLQEDLADPMIDVVFDGGDFNVNLAVLDKTKID
jgi:hypothetical protein